MHILLLPSWYSTIDKPWRGAFFRDQALALSRHGLRVGLAFVERRSLSGLTAADLMSSHFQITSEEEDGIPTIRMKGWSTFAQTTPGSLLWCQLTRLLVRSYVSLHGVPDVIHGHAAMWGGHAAMLCARGLDRPFVVTEHSGSILTMNVSRPDRERVRAVYRRANRVVSVSKALKGSVDAIAAAAVADVAPNAVDSAFFHLPPISRPSQSFVFIAVGDLVPSKRMDMLLRAFARLVADDRSVRLVIAGTGKEATRLHHLAQSLGVADAVEFTGALSRPDVRERMWKANALVLSSDFETFGVVLIEALATGLPVIATRCGGPDDIVTPDLGVLIERGDEGALLRAMSEIMDRPFNPVRLREAAIRRFDYRVLADKLCAIYDSVCGRKAAA